MNLLKNSFLYLIFTTFNRAIPFLMLPLLTKYLSPSEFGVWSIYQTMIYILTPFIGMGMSNHITRNFFKRKKELLNTIIFNIFVVLIISSIIILSILFIVFLFKDTLFGIDMKYIFLIPFIIFVQMVNLFNLTILRNEDKVIKYGVFEVGISLINILIAVLLIVLFKYGWFSMAIGLFIGQFIFFIFSLKYIFKNYIKININKRLLKHILFLSIPLIPHTLSDGIVQFSDRIFINEMINSKEVGIYTVATYFGFLVYMITTSFNKSWTPFMMKELSKNSYESKVKIVKYTYLYFPIVFILVILTYIFAKIIFPYFIDEKYNEALQYIFLIGITYMIRGFYSMIYPYFIYVGNTKILATIAIISSIINIILNYFFIKYFQVWGAIWATLISFIILSGISWYYANRYYPMPWLDFFKKSDK